MSYTTQMKHPASNTQHPTPCLLCKWRVARAQPDAYQKGSSKPKTMNVVQAHQLLFEQVAGRACDPTHIVKDEQPISIHGLWCWEFLLLL